MRSVYIHIPFCKSICSYCDFCKFLYNTAWADKYLEVLEQEINSFYDNDLINTIYIGGGTPTSLNFNQLIKLFNIIKLFKTTDDLEFTMECNINDITEELLSLLKNNGVNRLSIGVQSLDYYKIKFLNRKHNKKMVQNNVQLIKKYGFNFNLDFMYATPIETYHMFKNDINEFLKLDPDHISTYSLIIEDNTMLKLNDIKPISQELDSSMYEYICKKLKKKGYNHYEVSNFAKEGRESKHNLTYWNNGEYYGFGLGAHGYVSELRYENTRSFNKYLKHQYRLNEFVISKKEDMENELILGLRKIEGINIVEFFNKYKVNIQDEFDIMPLIKEKLLVLEDNHLKIPEDKIYIMNTILTRLI